MQEESFSITGYQNRPIACDLLKPSPSAIRLALIMPGGGYNVDRPLLYFATEVLLQRNYQVLNVHTNYSRFQAYQDLASRKDGEAMTQLLRQESVAIAHALENLKINPTIIIGKSAGTYAMTQLVPRFHAKSCVWLTPWLRDQWFTLKSVDSNHLVVIGDADPYYEEAKPNLPSHAKIILGADHSLEIANNISESIVVLRVVTEMICNHIDGVN